MNLTITLNAELLREERGVPLLSYLPRLPLASRPSNFCFAIRRLLSAFANSLSDSSKIFLEFLLSSLPLH